MLKQNNQIAPALVGPGLDVRHHAVGDEGAGDGEAAAAVLALEGPLGVAHVHPQVVQPQLAPRRERLAAHLARVRLGAVRRVGVPHVGLVGRVPHHLRRAQLAPGKKRRHFQNDTLRNQLGQKTRTCRTCG